MKRKTRENTLIPCFVGYMKEICFFPSENSEYRWIRNLNSFATRYDWEMVVVGTEGHQCVRTTHGIWYCIGMHTVLSVYSNRMRPHMFKANWTRGSASRKAINWRIDVRSVFALAEYRVDENCEHTRPYATCVSLIYLCIYIYIYSRGGVHSYSE